MFETVYPAKPPLRWVNGITGLPIYFCSRYCAAKFGISWVESTTERHECEVCRGSA